MELNERFKSLLEELKSLTETIIKEFDIVTICAGRREANPNNEIILTFNPGVNNKKFIAPHL